MKKAIFLLLGIFLISFASAVYNSSIYNGSAYFSAESLRIPENQTVTRYIPIHSSITYIPISFINLTALNVSNTIPFKIAWFNITNISQNYYNQSFDRGINETVDDFENGVIDTTLWKNLSCVGGSETGGELRLEGAGTSWNCAFANFSKYSISGDIFNNYTTYLDFFYRRIYNEQQAGFYAGISIYLTNGTNTETILQISHPTSYSVTDAHLILTKYPNKTVFYNYNNGEVTGSFNLTIWNNKVYLMNVANAGVGANGLSHVYLSHVNRTNNIPSNISMKTISEFGNSISSYINNYCTYTDNYCYVPIQFYSQTNITLNYSDFYISNLGFDELAVNYSATVAESTNNNFSLNLSFDSDYYNYLSVYLIYNNTAYSASTSQTGNNRVYSAIATAPAIETNTYVPFYWRILLNDGSDVYYNSSNYTQLVTPISPLVVSSAVCTDKAYIFDFKDENNLTSLNSDVEYNIQFGIQNGTTNFVYGNISNTNKVYICINTTISTTWTIGEGQLNFKKNGYVDRRYYFFRNIVITNNTQNITLYHISDDLDTTFELNAENQALSPIDNIIIAVMRWYPNLNDYEIVEMGLTDETGSVPIHIVAEDVDYRLVAYDREGNILKMDTPSRLLCLVAPCTYTLRILDDETDFTSFLSIVYEITYNYTSGIWTFIYSDSSQQTNYMNMTIYRDTSTTSYPVCSSQSSGFVGVLSCDTSTYTTGRLRAVVRREASPIITLVEKIVDLSSSAFKSTYGLWLSFLIAVPIVTFFAFVSPIFVIVGGIISLIPALYLGIINWAIIGGIAVIGGIIAHFIKRV